MKRYEVMINNGPYPLSYMCDTIAEAYGCMTELKEWLPSVRDVNLDYIMEMLVDMRRQGRDFYESKGWAIIVHEDEV